MSSTFPLLSKKSSAQLEFHQQDAERAQAAGPLCPARAARGRASSSCPCQFQRDGAAGDRHGAGRHLGAERLHLGEHALMLHGHRRQQRQRLPPGDQRRGRARRPARRARRRRPPASARRRTPAARNRGTRRTTPRAGCRSRCRRAPHRPVRLTWSRDAPGAGGPGAAEATSAPRRNGPLTGTRRLIFHASYRAMPMMIHPMMFSRAAERRDRSPDGDATRRRGRSTGASALPASPATRLGAAPSPPCLTLRVKPHHHRHVAERDRHVRQRHRQRLIFPSAAAA